MTASGKQAIALIPARAGSKRIEHKNIYRLNGHPLIAYTISAAIDSGIFDKIFVSTESSEYAEISKHYGADVEFLRPKEYATDESPDIEWVEFSLRELSKRGQNFDYFSILRQTSPLRTSSTIQRAFGEFLSDESVDSLRAVELCTQHPGKMWRIVKNRLVPVMARQDSGVDWFSSPTQTLPEVWVQNASLEFAHVRCVLSERSITGKAILPFKTKFPEGLDINRPEDIVRVEGIVSQSAESLPRIRQRPFD
ncbi:MAG: cytidylyltransferase domain-containing protein [Acidimicrobiaceae bacterium]